MRSTGVNNRPFVGQGDLMKCEVCQVEPSPTVDCQECGEEYGQCDDCLLGYEVKCPHCDQ